jgi:serine/threonine-protein kinase HipA
MIEVDAYIYGKKIGTLMDHKGTIYFQYDKEFLVSGIEISPLKLPLSDAIYTNYEHKHLYNGLAGVFFDSLPDKHGMAFIDRYFERIGLRASEVTLLHKLSFIGDRGMGAIEYFPKEHEEDVLQADIINAKDAYEQMKQSIDNQSSSIEELMNILDSVSPVGGGRPKMLVQYNKTTQEIKINTKSISPGFIRAIIKFDEVYEGVGSIDLTKLEFIMMSIAKDIGIDTAKFELIEENGFYHLLVERFDRTSTDTKIHMCSASALMHTDISIVHSTTYEHLFMLTKQITKSQRDIEELFKRMVLNVLVFNFDDHAKNFAFLMDERGKWHLSPAYDITYSKGLAKRHISTICGKSLDITREDLLKIASKYAITQSFANKTIDTCIEAVKSFEVRAKELHIKDGDIQIYKKDIDSQIKLLSEMSGIL